MLPALHGGMPHPAGPARRRGGGGRPNLAQARPPVLLHVGDDPPLAGGARGRVESKPPVRFLARPDTGTATRAALEEHDALAADAPDVEDEHAPVAVTAHVRADPWPAHAVR